MHIDLQAKIDSLLREVKNASNVAAAYDDCAEMATEFAGSHKLGLSPDTYTEGGLVFVFVYDCASLKTIPPLIRFLRKRGHKVLREPEDNADANKRTYYLDNIQICVYLSKAEGAECKYVQVGVKEVPVFELRCASAEVAQ